MDALANVGVNPRLQVGAATSVGHHRVRTPSILKTDDVALGSSMENNVYDALPLAMNGSARDPSAFAGLAVRRGQLQHPGGRPFHRFVQRRPDVSERSLYRRPPAYQRRHREPTPAIWPSASRSKPSTSSRWKPPAPRPCMKGRALETTSSNREPTNSMAESSNTSAIPISTPAASSRSHSHRAPERIRRHHRRPDQEEQDLLLRQLRRLPLRFRHAASWIQPFPRRRSAPAISAPSRS